MRVSVCLYVCIAPSVFYNPLSQFCVFAHACVIIVIAYARVQRRCTREGSTTKTPTTRTTSNVDDIPQKKMENRAMGDGGTQLQLHT